MYTENGVGYYASSVSVYPYVMNESWSNATAFPESYTGSTGRRTCMCSIEPMFWLTVSASSGGNVTPTSQWVPTGNAVGIDGDGGSPGYHFLDWTSVGAGGSTVAEEHNASVTIHPNGAGERAGDVPAGPGGDVERDGERERTAGGDGIHVHAGERDVHGDGRDDDGGRAAERVVRVCDGDVVLGVGQRDAVGADVVVCVVWGAGGRDRCRSPRTG